MSLATPPTHSTYSPGNDPKTWEMADSGQEQQARPQPTLHSSRFDSSRLIGPVSAFLLGLAGLSFRERLRKLEAGVLVTCPGLLPSP